MNTQVHSLANQNVQVLLTRAYSAQLDVFTREKELENIKRELWSTFSLKYWLQQCMKAKLKLAMSKQQLRQAFEEAVEHIFEIPSVSDEERTTVCAYKSNWSISWIRMVLYCCEENRWDLISLLIDHLISPEAQTESCSSALPICFKQLFDEYSLFPSDVTFNVIRRPIIKLDSEVVLGNWIIETKTPENTTEHVLKAFSCSLTGQREIALHKYICSQSDIFEYVPQIVTVGEVLSMPALVTNYVTKQETMLYSNKEQMKLTQDLIKMLCMLHENNIKIGDIRPESVVIEKTTLQLKIIDLEAVWLIENDTIVSDEYNNAAEKQKFWQTLPCEESGYPIYAKLTQQLLEHFLGNAMSAPIRKLVGLLRHDGSLKQFTSHDYIELFEFFNDFNEINNNTPLITFAHGCIENEAVLLMDSS